MAAYWLLGDLALLNDPWQPAVLRMIRLAGEAGTAAGKPVGVCSEAAADPLLAAVLVGLGASSLSMSPRERRLVRGMQRLLSCGSRSERAGNCLPANAK